MPTCPVLPRAPLQYIRDDFFIVCRIFGDVIRNTKLYSWQKCFCLLCCHWFLFIRLICRRENTIGRTVARWRDRRGESQHFISSEIVPHRGSLSSTRKVRTHVTGAARERRAWCTGVCTFPIQSVFYFEAAAESDTKQPSALSAYEMLQALFVFCLVFAF